MVTIVGSTNPAKVEGVQLAINVFWPKLPYRVEGVDVDSGVRPQPMSLQEAQQGAFNRAKKVGEANSTIDLAIGIEGGIWPSSFAPDGVHFPEWYDTQWVVVWARQHNTWWCAATVSIPVPPAIMKCVDGGAEMGSACDMVFGLEESKVGPGLTGLLAEMHYTRAQAIRDATLLALGKVRHPSAYF